MVTIGEIRKFVRGADQICAYLLGDRIYIGTHRGDTHTSLDVKVEDGHLVGEALHSLHRGYLTRPFSGEFGVVMTKKQ